MKEILLVSISAILFLAACKKENEPIQQKFELPQGVFIVNQGAFNSDNASLSYFVPGEGKLYDSLFLSINSAILGDVAQSINVRENLTYIVVNNSGLIYCIDNRYGEVRGKITGLTSPRNMLFVSEQKAYVSDLYSSKLTIINPFTYQVIGEIELNRTSEEMVLVGTTAYVANYSAYSQQAKNDVIISIDTDTDQMKDTIKIGIEPNSIVLDKNENIWVLCSGGFLNEENPTLWKINGANGTIMETFTFDVLESSPLALKINGARDELYFLNNGVYKMSIDAVALPDQAFISQEQGQYFGYMALDPESGYIYIGDPVDYQSDGKVYRYAPDGSLVHTIVCGIVPAAFGFNK